MILMVMMTLMMIIMKEISIVIIYLQWQSLRVLEADTHVILTS